MSDSGVVTGIADGEAEIRASVDSLVGARHITIASTPGVTTIRLLNAVEGFGTVFRPSSGPPVDLSFGESREQTVPAGTLQVTADGSSPGFWYDAAWLDSEQFLGFLPAGTHSTLVAVSNPSWTRYFGTSTIVPLWDWTTPVPADSVMVRVVIAAFGGYNVYFVDPGGSLSTRFLAGCYLDWPYAASSYSARAAGAFDILLQIGKSLDGPATVRLPVTPDPGHAMTYVIVGDLTGFKVVALVDR